MTRIRTLWILISPILVGAVCYLVIGHAAIAWLHQGRGPTNLDGIMRQRTQVPLLVYQRKADSLALLAGGAWLGLGSAAAVAWRVRRRAAFRRGVCVALWLLMSCALLEATTRIFFHVRGLDIGIYRQWSWWPAPRLFVKDPVLGFRMLPSVRRNALAAEFQVVYQTNRLGLREREVGPRRAGRPRVLFLGDSQTFGWGVEVAERFTDRIGVSLPAVEVINAGVPAWGIHQMRAWFERDGAALTPDLVVCAVIGGDFRRAVDARALEAEAASPAVPTVATARSQLENQLAGVTPAAIVRGAELVPLEASWLYLFGRVTIQLLWERHKLEARDRAALQVLASVDAGLPWSERAAEFRAVAQDELTLLRAAAGRANARLLLAYIDTEPLPWLEPVASTVGVDLVDVSACIASQPGARFRLDPHYTALGHAALAACLGPVVKERLAKVSLD